MEIASHIPTVQSQLVEGKSLTEIFDDPIIGKCARIYFADDSEGMPRVVKVGDFYMFDSNGRHRIIAAREAGFDIPVRIIGEWRKKVI